VGELDMANAKAEKKALDVIWLILLLAVPVTVIVTSMSEGQLKTYLVPLVIGCVVIPLMVWQILRDLFSKRERNLVGLDALAEGALALQKTLSEQERDGKAVQESAPAIREALPLRLIKQKEVGVCIELLFLIVLVWLFGFLIAAPVSVFSYAKLRGERWLVAFGVALGIFVVLFIFKFAFRLQLYKGLLFL
jgi:hypothetical protein